MEKTYSFNHSQYAINFMVDVTENCSYFLVTGVNLKFLKIMITIKSNEAWFPIIDDYYTKNIDH